MKGRRLLGILAIVSLGLALGVSKPDAGSQQINSFVLFGGSNTDTLELRSNWIPVFGAQRIIIRTWSAKAAFHASTDADSNYSDSLTTFKVLFTDSVTANKIGADSIVVDPASVAVTVGVSDSARVMVAVKPLPINKELRGAANGSGLLSFITGTAVNGNAAIGAPFDPSTIIAKKYMRIAVTPLRRNTVTGGNSTSGERVAGLKGLRMVAHVVYANK